MFPAQFLVGKNVNRLCQLPASKRFIEKLGFRLRAPLSPSSALMTNVRDNITQSYLENLVTACQKQCQASSTCSMKLVYPREGLFLPREGSQPQHYQHSELGDSLLLEALLYLAYSIPGLLPQDAIAHPPLACHFMTTKTLPRECRMSSEG